MIEIKDLSYRYKKSSTQVFDHFSLNFEAGNIYGLLGKNGVGKSTLLYAMTGMLMPRAGQILMDGLGVSKRRPSTLTKFYLVPEEFDLPDTSLKQYVNVNAPFYPNFSMADLEKHLQVFNLSVDLNLKQLSMGQKKKVYMCFALATNTEVLLMDEPTNGLDIPSKSQFRKIIAQSMNEKRIIIISTHQVGDVENLLDHVVIVERNQVLLNESMNRIGQKLFFGANEPDAIYAQPTYNGNATVTKNDGTEESPINLELLFNATLTEPEKIRDSFK